MIPIDHADTRPMGATPASLRPWVRLLAWTAAVGAGVDAAVMGVLGEVIPPVLAGVVLTLAGLALLRRRPRVGIGLLGVVGVLLVVSGAPFALPNVGHPESAVGFGHAVIHLLTRLVTIVAAVGAWRQLSPVAARRFATLTAAGLAATVVVAVGASVADPGDTAEPGDVVAEVRDFEFPAQLQVASGGTLFVDNADLIRHTFTVEGTALSQELPAHTGRRFVVELEPGTYRVRCDVPGHESMEAHLVVD